jgi:uncharacterized membrane protein YkvA (DUF1232 family)
MCRAAGQSRRQPAVATEEEPVLRTSRGWLRNEDWKEQAQIIRREVRVIWLIFKDSRTPWYAKLAAAGAVGYVFSPIQLIPSFIPVIGFLDDFLAVSIGIKLTHWLAPEAVVRDCRERALASARHRDEQVSTVAGRAGAVAIAAIWLIIMAAATVWLYKP